jgi:adenylyl- and sulfurtransferase ThiI
MATLVSLNSGTNLDTGSVRRIFPSSTSIRIATPVIGLDIDAIGKMASRAIGRFDSRSITPCASKCVTWPLRATTVTAPEISLASMARTTT